MAVANGQTDNEGSQQASESRQTPRRPQRASESLPVFTPAREAAALSFAERHHPELVSLLKQLAQHDSTEYENAIRQLFQTSETIAGVEERSPEIAQFQLRRWKLESRIQLLAAKLRMQSSPKIREQLRDLLTEREALRLEQLEFDRRRTEARLDRIEQSIAAQQQDPEARVERQLRQLLREADDTTQP
jgi:regulator of replication initiation timing